MFGCVGALTTGRVIPSVTNNPPAVLIVHQQWYRRMDNDTNID
jgi:hypothetical protein